MEALWDWLKIGQTREVVLPSPRVKVTKGHGPCHSWYCFSLSTIQLKNGQNTVVESRFGERVVVKAGRDARNFSGFSVPMLLSSESQNGQSTNDRSCPATALTSPNPLVSAVTTLCSWPAKGQTCQPCSPSP